MRTLISIHTAGIALLASAFLLGTGCGKSPMSSSSAAASSAPRPVNDGQIATQIKAQMQADSALSSLPIQTQVNHGVVTLSGQVNDEAARELAANDAAQVSGVRTVVNNLTVQTAAAAAATAPAAQTASDDAAARKAAALKKQEAADKLRQQRREQARQAREQQQAEASQQAMNNSPASPADNSNRSQLQPQAPPQPVQPPPPPPPPPRPVTQTITIPAGTDLAVRISESLETGKTQTGDKFHGALADNLVINGQTAIRRGASVTGVVTDAKDAGRFKGNSQLTLELQRITTPNKTLPLSTEELVQQGKGRGKNTAAKAGGGALFGTLLGALAGGGKGALIGAAAGGAAGTGVNAVTRGEQVKIASESILHFKLSQPLKVTVTTMPGSSSVTSYNSSDSPQLQQPQ